ncbi:MAG: hypothetical protein ACKOWF_06740 [Chloroflexota bacterium]
MTNREDPAERLERYRQSRQVIPGRDLAPPSDPIDYAGRYAAGGAGDLPYFAALAALVLLSAIVWAIGGMGAATPLLLALGLALLAAWVLL